MESIRNHNFILHYSHKLPRLRGTQQRKEKKEKKKHTLAGFKRLWEMCEL